MDDDKLFAIDKKDNLIKPCIETQQFKELKNYTSE